MGCAPSVSSSKVERLSNENSQPFNEIKPQPEDEGEMAKIQTSAEIFVKEKINSSPVVIFSRKGSEKTKSIEEILQKYHVPSETLIRVDLDDQVPNEVEEIENNVLEAVPIVFIGADHVGTLGNVIKMDESGELKVRLELLGLTGPIRIPLDPPEICSEGTA